MLFCIVRSLRPFPFGRGLASLLLVGMLPAITPISLAQEVTDSTDEARQLSEITVFGQAIHRNRAPDVNPVLTYGQEFFQRYEPESVGDMLKRVPGVAFSSDVGEYDAPQLRGLPSGFTQVLINGERIPGAGTNRSVFVDRIPAELVERVEIVRSPSARLDSQGIAGTVNIILKDALEFRGLYASAGGAYYEGDAMRDIDDKLRGRGSLTYGGQAGDLAYLLSASFTERRTPKNKETTVFEAGELQEFVTERDIRDSDDTALNWDFDFENGRVGRWTLDGFFIFTDRTEEEFVELYEPEVSDLAKFRDEKVNIDAGRFTPLGRETQLEDIEQTQWEIDLGTEQRITPTITLQAGVSHGRFDNDITETENEFDLEADERATARETIDTLDRETEINVDVAWSAVATQTIDLGGLVRLRDRDESLREFEVGDAGLEEETPASGVFEIDENTVAGYVMHTWNPMAIGGLTLEHGLRVEYTDLAGRNQNALETHTSNTYTDVNPSLNYRFDVTDYDRLRLSAARTLRRPNFNQLTPFEAEETPDDDAVTRGNPNLEVETAWGIDVGYERLFYAGRGIAGINVFYRDISDLIELRDTGEDQVDGEDAFDVFTYSNVGDGKLYGVEFDVSTPLTAFRLPNTSLFGNAALIETEVTDEFTGEERDFNLTPAHVFNVGFNHELPRWQFSFGMSYQDQGEMLDLEPDEVGTQDRDGFLEAFVEKRFGDNWLVRLTGSNLLDQTKVERKTGFDSLQDRIDGSPEVSEIELEETGPWARLVVRAAF